MIGVLQNRTGRRRLNDAAGVVGVIGLGGAAVLHGWWAAGSSWPATDKDDLADLVVGRDPFPGSGMTAAVAGLLGAAAVVAAASSGLLPVPGARTERIVRLGSTTVSAGLLTRGLGGLGLSALGIGGASDRFRRWDLRVYSPLCLALAGAVALGSAGR